MVEKKLYRVSGEVAGFKNAIEEWTYAYSPRQARLHVARKLEKENPRMRVYLDPDKVFVEKISRKQGGPTL